MAITEELKIEIIAQSRRAVAELKKTEKGVEGIGDTAKKAGKLMAAAFTGAAIYAGLRKIGTLLMEASKIASDAEEVFSKFTVVFKDQATEVGAWARTYSESVGRSSTETMKFAATLQDTFVPLGFAREEAGELSKKLVVLANDVGSFNNIMTDDVIRDFQSALVGNTETLRKYGVVASQSAIVQEALSSGLIDTASGLDAASKAQAIYQIIVAGTADAQGDLLRTMDSSANVTIRLDTAINDLGITVGNVVNDYLTPFKSTLADIIGVINKHADDGGIEKIIKAYNIFKDVTMSMINPIGTLIKGIRSLTKIMSDEEETWAAMNVWGAGLAAQLASVEAEAKAAAAAIAALAKEEADAAAERAAIEAARLESLLLVKGAAQKEQLREYNTLLEIKARLIKEAAAAEPSLDKGAARKQQLREYNEALATKKRLIKEAAEAEAAAAIEAQQEIHDAFIDRITKEWEARAETARIVQEYADAELAQKEALKLAEQIRHDEKMAHIQAELNSFSNYAGSAQQLFANLINSMMQGDEELSDKRKKSIIALFWMQKIAAIGQIALNTASAVVEALPNIPLSIAVAALGASQLIAAGAARPPVKLADGGIILPTPGGTSAILGEAGKPEAVIPLDRLGGIGTTIVNVYGTVGSQEDVATWVYEGIERARHMGKVA